MVGTRTADQVRSHYQKHRQKQERIKIKDTSLQNFYKLKQKVLAAEKRKEEIDAAEPVGVHQYWNSMTSKKDLDAYE